MKFTTLEPLNQRFNEVLKKENLTKVVENSTEEHVIEHYFSLLKHATDRFYDETNETCSQIFITKLNQKKCALVFITNGEVPAYDIMYIVEESGDK